MKRILLIFGLLIFLAIFVFTLVMLFQRSKPEESHFDTAHPVMGNITKKTVATGSIVPRREVEIKPRVSGILESLPVEAGNIVKAGDLIASIRIVPNVVNLNQAESSLQAARINLQNAERERNRFSKLLEQSLVPQAEFARVDYEYELRKQEIASAKSNLQLIRSGASKRGGKVSNQVRSTMSGMVTEVPVKEGVSVTETNNFNPGTTIATVADMTDMIFQGKVDESEVAKLEVGMPLKIKIGAIEDEEFSGTLEYIAPKGVVDEGAIQFEIRAAMQKTDSAEGKSPLIRSNYSANADIVLGEREDVLILSEMYLQFDKEGVPFVEVETSPQTFEQRSIETGLSDGINIEILSGITEEDLVKNPTTSDDAASQSKGRRRKKS